MTETAANNKRLAKNTLLLYFRMLFMMGISLYTSRVVLKVLGVEDFGIYNAVGGVVAMFGFISGPMAGATQRYLTFALGKGDIQETNKVFSTCVNIYFGVALILVFVAETIGLWFLYNKMLIPDEKMDAAFWVLQISLATTIVLLLSIPYNAAIIAHERMSAFAYISIMEAILKLVIVYAIQVTRFDNLIFYTLLLLGIQMVIRLFYTIYCQKHFEEARYRFIFDKKLTKEITSFAGWSMLGNMAAVGFSQGLNVLLNIFFGPIVNAARGIAAQVGSTVTQFVNSFQTAINPQITKAYAAGEHENLLKLINRSSRFSFYLLLLLTLPIIIETPFLLKIWLGVVPEYTVTFVRIMLTTIWMTSLSNPIITSVLATGNIKRYQQYVGGLLLSIVPISYVCLKIGMPAYSVFVVHLIIEILTHILRLSIAKRLVGISGRGYLQKVVFPISKVLVGTIPFIVIFLYIRKDTWGSFLFSIITCTIIVSVLIFTMGLTRTERLFLTEKIKTNLSKIK